MLPLSFLSWNLAMMNRSNQAPPHWGTDKTEDAIRRTVLQHTPDLVLFQELPGRVPFIETNWMLRANPKSHSGHLATLVKSDPLARKPEVKVVPGCAILATFDSLTIANVHLQAGPGGAAERLQQLARVVEASPTDRLLIVGDTNTRMAESEALAEAGLVGERPPRPTWNSKRNRFNSAGPEFSAYFTRWFASPGVQVKNVRVLDEPIEEDDRHFHLSDHFALLGTVGVRAETAGPEGSGS